MRIDFKRYLIRLKQIDNQPVDNQFNTLMEMVNFVEGYFTGYKDGLNYLQDKRVK